jgi:hypothetical protein
MLAGMRRVVLLRLLRPSGGDGIPASALARQLTVARLLAPQPAGNPCRGGLRRRAPTAPARRRRRSAPHPDAPSRRRGKSAQLPVILSVLPDLGPSGLTSFTFELTIVE